jgi:hypothetical protein
MDVSKIISISKLQTSASYDNTTLLDYLNIVYADIFSRLSAVNKKYTWQ